MPPRYLACAKCRMKFDVDTMLRETSQHPTNAHCCGRLVCDECYDGPDMPPAVMPGPDDLTFKD